MNQKILIPALAAIVAAAGFYMVILKPKRQEASQLQTKITKKQGELDQARTLLASNQKARETYRAAYASVVRLGKAVPADDDVRSLVVQLDAAAKASHVDFQSINVGGGAAPATPAAGAVGATQLPPGATVGPAGFPVMPFTFAFDGSFFNLGDFFKRLDSFVTARNKQLSVTGRLLTVDALQLAPGPDGFPKIKATVSATSYLVSPLEGLTGGATPQGPAGVTAAPATPGATPAAPAPSAPAPSTATSTGALR